jgi:hypothetical protein
MQQKLISQKVLECQGEGVGRQRVAKLNSQRERNLSCDLFIKCSFDGIRRGTQLFAPHNVRHALVEVQIREVARAVVERADLLRRAIDPNHPKPVFREVHCRRESDISQADDRDGCGLFSIFLSKSIFKPPYSLR